MVSPQQPGGAPDEQMFVDAELVAMNAPEAVADRAAAEERFAELLPELLQTHRNYYVAVYRQCLLGFHKDSEFELRKRCLKHRLPAHSFIVRKVTPGAEGQG